MAMISRTNGCRIEKEDKISSGRARLKQSQFQTHWEEEEMEARRQ
jgi:hypothetical protein